MKKLFAALLSLTLVLSLSLSAGAFSFVELDSEDIFSEEILEQESASAWAADDVAAARALGLVTESTSYYLSNTITRYQFADLIVNFVELVLGEEIEANPEGTFSDTDEIAVLKASAAGIVTGYTDGTFGSEITTNREQIATMIARAINYIDTQSGVDMAPESGDLSAFSDASAVSSFAVDSVARLAANGIMNGTTTTTLSPQNSCTIEQSIVLIYRLYTA